MIKKSKIHRLILLFLLTVTQNLYAATQFLEKFDSQNDWTTDDKDNAYSLPQNWDYAYTEETWHPHNIPGSQPSMKITGSNSEQVYGGTGKSFVNYVESYNDTTNNGFTSDGLILKDIEPTNEVYVEFKIKFQPGFATNDEYGMLKIFRVLSWDGNGSRSKFFSNGNNAPVYVFDWVHSEYGVRQLHAFRCDAQETNYYCTNPKILNPPREINNGDMSANFTTNVKELSAQIPDLLNGGIIPYNELAFHDQVYNDEWHTLAFYLKQNTAPGVQDGILKFWLDDQQLIDMNEIPWVGVNGTMDAKWNSVSFGGNDRFHFNLDENAPISDRERWYAIDDIVISDKVPDSTAGTLAGVQFLEQFDEQDNWTTGDKDNIYTYPTNWDYANTGENWHPSDISESQPSITITGDKPEQVFGGTGKALINYVESYNDTSNNGYTSEGSITKDFEPTDELFVQFKLKFQPGFAANDEYGVLKIIKAMSFDGDGPREKLSETGYSAPVYNFDWIQNEWGLRHRHGFRCDDQESNFHCTAPTILNPPREINWGTMSANFTSDIKNLSPQLPDLVMGGNISPSGTIFHNQVYGDQWHTLAFYLKQNSAPGQQDGSLKFWLDEQLIIDMNEIPWIGENGNMDAKWNSVTFGGIDRFHFNLDENAPITERERWYSIDDIMLLDKIPENTNNVNMELKCYWELVE